MKTAVALFPSQIDAVVQAVYVGGLEQVVFKDPSPYLPYSPFPPPSFKASNFLTLPFEYFHQLAASSSSEIRNLPSFSP